MADNFDLRQFIADNKIGPYINKKTKIAESELSEEQIEEMIDVRKVQSADDRVRNLISNISTNSNIPTEEKMGLLDALQELMDFIEDVGYDAEREEEEGPVSDYSRRRSSELYEGLSAEAIDRMDGLVNQRDVAIALEKLSEVKDELKSERFEENDVLQYIHMLVGDYIGRPKK